MASQKKLFITGCGGLIGSAVADLGISEGYKVIGIDSDARGSWFGKAGSVYWRMLELNGAGVDVRSLDFRSPEALKLVRGADVVVHCASQPSHDLSVKQPVEDAALNFMGTVELLEATRRYAPEAVFVFLSTNKVYGDRVNHLPYRIEGDRYELVSGETGVEPFHGVSEEMSMDSSLHTPFGASKAAADLMVQEYRRCYGLRTVTLRCGCLTGPTGSAVELHGFLGYLVKAAVSGTPYTVYGYEGLQVRDNLAASDLARAILMYAENPKQGVYNMGGGRENSISIREAVEYLAERGYTMPLKHGPERLGDHRVWITSTKKFRTDYPEWKITKDVWGIIDDMVDACVRSRSNSVERESVPTRGTNDGSSVTSGEVGVPSSIRPKDAGIGDP